MKCGVKFCGGCNPRYDRGKALKEIQKRVKGDVNFVIAEEDVPHDVLLVIGGCSNCCASCSQYMTTNDPLKMWDEGQITRILDQIDDIREVDKNKHTED